MAWNAATLTMPVKVYHGARDNAVNVRHSDEMVEAIKARGGNVEYIRMEEVGHNVWVHAYNKELAEWMLQY